MTVRIPRPVLALILALGMGGVLAYGRAQADPRAIGGTPVEIFAHDGTSTITTGGAHGGLPVEGVAGGTAIPISGTVTAGLPANAAQESGGNLATLAGAVSGSRFQTQTQTNSAADGNTAANVGLITAGMLNTGGIQRMVAASGAGTSGASTGVELVTAPYLYNGASFDATRTPNVFKPLSAVTINAETTIWTPGSGKKFRIMGFCLVGSAAGNITLKDNTSGTTILVIPTAAGGACSASPPMGNGLLSAGANNVLTATGSVNMTLSGFVFGDEE